MAVTLQALQADGTWAVRNAFVTENRKVVAGSMKPAELEAIARNMMARWNATYPQGGQLRVHNTDNDPKPKLKPIVAARTDVLQTVGATVSVRDDADVFLHISPRVDACNHDFQGWREFSDGNGGEQVCTKCGMGAMHHTLMGAA